MSSQTPNPLAQLAAQQRAAAAAANPVFYVPASERDQIRGYFVLKVYAVCHPKTSDSESGETNHWTLSFDIGNGESVGLDIQPDLSKSYTNGGFKASVIISYPECVVTNNARKDLVSVTYSRPVGWYVDYLASAGRFKYAFTPGNVGCWNWMIDTLQLLADAGEVNSTESASARSALAYLWPDHSPSAPAAGTYFP